MTRHFRITLLEPSPPAPLESMFSPLKYIFNCFRWLIDWSIDWLIDWLIEWVGNFWNDFYEK